MSRNFSMSSGVSVRGGTGRPRFLPFTTGELVISLRRHDYFLSSKNFRYTTLGTLIPFKGGALPNDGMNILKNFSLTDEEITQRCFEASLQRSLPSEKEAMSKLSIDESIARYYGTSESLVTLVLLVDKMVDANDSRRNEYVAKMVAHSGIRPRNLGKFLDGYITGQLIKGLITGNPYFDELSQKLAEIEKNTITSRGTRGSVLIDLGRIEEGKAMLEDVLDKTTSTIDKTYANIFLALAAKQQSNLTLAREHAEKASKIDPACPALKRVSDLLASPA